MNERPLTLGDCRRLLGSYALPEQFDSALNQALERIHAEGQWPGGRVEADLTDYVEDYVITLPYEYETLLAAAWIKNPCIIVDQSTEYMSSGPGVQTAGEGNGTIVDLGFVEVADDGDFPQFLHRYKITFPFVDGQTLTGLLRRRFQYLSDEQDLVYPAHLGALKNGLLAIRMEDEGDPERAQFYWGQCFNFLSQSASQSRIGSRQPLNIRTDFATTFAPKSFF